MSPPRYVLIANPGTKRCELFCRALREFGADLAVVPWTDVVRTEGRLDGMAAFDRAAIVRLESPGKNVDVTRLLCSAGDRSGTDWNAVEIARGQLVRPGLWYAGFCRVLDGLKRSFDARPHLRPTACPLAIATMFDKNRTLEMLRAANLPVPDWIPPDELPNSPNELLARLRERNWKTAYVKLNTGAAAVGIVYIRFDSDGEPTGVTTLLERGGSYFNTRRLRTVAGEELNRCLEFLLDEGATVQRGLPHAQLDGQNADLRVVCVGGRPVAMIFRLSPHPMTNLHLGGRRGNWERCRAAIPNRVWLDALASCAEAARQFDSISVGVDLLFEPGFARHHVLEVNAFGDFFPGWTDDRGRSIHRIEIAECRSSLNGLA